MRMRYVASCLISVFLFISTAAAGPIWMRRSESLLAASGEECLARAFRALRAEGFSPDQNMSNGVWGSKGSRWTLIVCNAAPASQTWANIVSSALESEAGAHYADHERVGARMGEPSTTPSGGQLLSARADGRGVGVVTWSNAPTNDGTWVSIVPAGTPDGQHTGRWEYTNKNTNGRYESGPLSPGRYEARFYGDSGYGKLLARVPFEVVGMVTDFLRVDLRGRTATVVWANAPTDRGAWVSVVPVGTPDGQHTGRWAYTNSTPSGTFETAGLEPGSYEARFYSDSGYGKIVSRTRFVVP
jgi:hypothetical protein